MDGHGFFSTADVSRWQPTEWREERARPTVVERDTSEAAQESEARDPSRVQGYLGRDPIQEPPCWGVGEC